MPETIVNFSEFAAMQNCEHYTRSEFGFRGNEVVNVFFANGAHSDGDTTHWNPPTDPEGMRLARIEFLKLKYEKYVTSYNHSRDSIAAGCELKARGAGSIGNEPGWYEGLQKMAEEIQAMETELYELKTQSKEYQEEKKNREFYEQRRAQERQEAREVMHKIHSLPSFTSKAQNR